MTPSAPYCVELHPAEALASLQQDPQVFATLRYTHTTAIDAQHPGHIQIALPSLGAQELIEVWRSSLPMQQAEHGQIRYQFCDDFMFGSLLIQDDAYPDLAQAAAAAYTQIHDTLESAGFPALLRMWNYFPRINQEADGLERYRSFCIGRHQVLDEWHFPEEQLPAATAIGTLGEGLLVYFVAGKRPGIQIENPRQISAFHYPEQYGPRSPTFSRATLVDWAQLYISGTASIVGHETRFPGDSAAQLEETLANLRIVIERAHKEHGLTCADLADLNLLRLYVRHPSEAALLQEQITPHLGPAVRLQILHGDICRSDLRLEIEAMYAPC